MDLLHYQNPIISCVHWRSQNFISSRLAILLGYLKLYSLRMTTIWGMWLGIREKIHNENWHQRTVCLVRACCATYDKWNACHWDEPNAHLSPPVLSWARQCSPGADAILEIISKISSSGWRWVLMLFRLYHCERGHSPTEANLLTIGEIATPGFAGFATNLLLMTF